MRARRTSEELITHLLSKRKLNSNGCWEWQGNRLKSGYGRIKVRRLASSNIQVHRLAAYLWKGFKLESPLDICHSCDNPPCFNPDHLFEGSRLINVQDCIRKGRMHAGKTQKVCPQGHEYTEANTYIYEGKRQCVTCKREHTMIWYWKYGRKVRGCKRPLRFRTREQLYKRGGFDG